MLRVRRYQQADSDAIWDLHERAMAAAGMLAPGPWDDDMRDVDTVYLRDGGDFLVGEDDGRIVAMGALRRISDTEVELKRLRVAPERQRSGIGQTMFVALLERAQDLGYATTRLDTAVTATPMQRLVSKHGFREVGRTTLAGIPSILYARRLDER